MVVWPLVRTLTNLNKRRENRMTTAPEKYNNRVNIFVLDEKVQTYQLTIQEMDNRHSLFIITLLIVTFGISSLVFFSDYHHFLISTVITALGLATVLVLDRRHKRNKQAFTAAHVQEMEKLNALNDLKTIPPYQETVE